MPKSISCSSYISNQKLTCIHRLIHLYFSKNPLRIVLDTKQVVSSFKRDKKNVLDGYARFVSPCTKVDSLWCSTRFEADYGLYTQNILYTEAADILCDTVRSLNIGD